MARRGDAVTLFLAGDVMTGRGIDQVLPHPGDPVLYESYVRDARLYVDLAEQANGPIARPADVAYIWGEALAVLQRHAPDARIVNLETSVTRRGTPWPGKGIHYRMHPDNLPCLTAAGIDCCVLANNHVLDWGPAGLEETLATLEAAGLSTAGAGRNDRAAAAPARIETARGARVLVFAFGAATSGIPPEWRAEPRCAGINYLPALSRRAAAVAASAIKAVRGPRDLVVASIHWGGNWGYAIPAEQRGFAQELIERGAVDVVHGHSSHHAKGIEIFRGKPILYGCGDFVNDYEGIAGYERYRPDLSLMYLLSVDAGSGELLHLRIVPFCKQRFSLREAGRSDTQWLAEALGRACAELGARIDMASDATLLVTAQPKGRTGSEPSQPTQAR